MPHKRSKAKMTERKANWVSKRSCVLPARRFNCLDVTPMVAGLDLASEGEYTEVGGGYPIAWEIVSLTDWLNGQVEIEWQPQTEEAKE
jgi:hypothetical protein